MKKVKVVFQGDSITDAGRDKRNYHDVGPGYPKYASELMIENHKDVEFEFINFGISGNRTCQLFDRLYPDALEFDPDVISILIGINDIDIEKRISRVHNGFDQGCHLVDAFLVVCHTGVYLQLNGGGVSVHRLYRGNTVAHCGNRTVFSEAAQGICAVVDRLALLSAVGSRLYRASKQNGV